MNRDITIENKASAYPMSRHCLCNRSGCLLRFKHCSSFRLEAARIAVEAACARVGDPRDTVFNEYFLRASWWTPWVGTNRIYSPAQMHGPARDRWNSLTAHYRLHRWSYRGESGDYIEVHMNSESSINHRSSYGGFFWCRFLIYTGAV